MVLAEKYAFEAERLVTDPEIVIAREECHTSRGSGSTFGPPSSGRNSNSQGLITASSPVGPHSSLPLLDDDRRAEAIGELCPEDAA